MPKPKTKSMTSGLLIFGTLALASFGTPALARDLPKTPDELISTVSKAITDRDMAVFEDLVNWKDARKIRKRVVSYQIRTTFGRPIRSITLEDLPGGRTEGSGKPGHPESQHARLPPAPRHLRRAAGRVRHAADRRVPDRQGSGRLPDSAGQSRAEERRRLKCRKRRQAGQPGGASVPHLCVPRNPGNSLICLLIQSELIHSSVQQRCCNALLGRFLPRLGPVVFHRPFFMREFRALVKNYRASQKYIKYIISKNYIKSYICVQVQYRMSNYYIIGNHPEMMSVYK